MSKSPARRAVAKIIADLDDRKGLKSEWRMIEPATQTEIITTWVNIIQAEYKPNKPAKSIGSQHG